MAMVKASLTLFGGDTLVVRCSERCHIHLMSAKVPGDSHADILSVQDRDSAYLTVPYSGTERSHRQPQPVAGALHQLRSRLIANARGNPGDILLSQPGLAAFPQQMTHLAD